MSTLSDKEIQELLDQNKADELLHTSKDSQTYKLLYKLLNTSPKMDEQRTESTSIHNIVQRTQSIEPWLDYVILIVCVALLISIGLIINLASTH